MAKPTKDNRKSVVDFGVGWVVIIYCLLMFFLYVGMCNDGANITAPNVAYRLGLEQGDIMNMNSLAGLVGVVFFIIAGQVNRKIGARMTSGICCIISGIAYILACNAPSIVIYTVCMCFVYGGIMSAGYVAGGTLVASWFPKKKGVVMGYTTMGHNFASAFYVQLVAILIAPTVAGTTNIGENFSTGIVPIGIAAIVLGILGMIFIRNEPWERGINPDNVSDEIYQKEYDTKDAVEGDGGWTTGKLLATKELWLAAITTGFFQICSVGVMSQLVIRNTQLGFSQQAAMNVMTILALGGVVGSWLVGVIDDAIGTKKTMVMFGIWYAIALLLNFTAVDSVTPLVYVSLFMIAMGIGGSANLHLWPPGFRQGEQCHLPHPGCSHCPVLPGQRRGAEDYRRPDPHGLPGVRRRGPGERAPGADGQRAQVQPRLDGGPQEVSCTASEPLPKKLSPQPRGQLFSLRPMPHSAILILSERNEVAAWRKKMAWCRSIMETARVRPQRPSGWPSGVRAGGGGW